jgi:hypothetical protein
MASGIIDKSAEKSIFSAGPAHPVTLPGVAGTRRQASWLQSETDIPSRRGRFDDNLFHEAAPLNRAEAAALSARASCVR